MTLSLKELTTGREKKPGFGDKHVATLQSEIADAQANSRLVLALAHGSRYRDDSMDQFIQHSTVFLATPNDADVLVKIGDKIVYQGRLTAGILYWTFVNWDQYNGDLVVINGSTYTVPRQRILQHTLMTCILFHPRMDIAPIDPNEANPIAA